MFYYLVIFSWQWAIILSVPQFRHSPNPSCDIYKSSNYSCVPYFQCDEDGYIKQDGAGIIDPRENFKSLENVDHDEALESVCDKLVDVCCNLGDGTHHVRNPRYVPQCGKRNIPEYKPIINRTSFGEWPHVCAIINSEDLSEKKLNTFKCAGSLISENVILTAAHCVNESTAKTIFVRCGEWDTSNEDEKLKHQEIQVKDILLHPDFNSGNLHNDFALLITETEFILQDHINPICLPEPNKEYEQKECVVNGWGKNKIGAQGEYQKILKQLKLPLVDNEECETKLRETRLGKFFELDDSFICAGGVKGVDTCKGDGGGPLVCRHKGSGPWVQEGIVSWGIGCGEKGIPAVYASVSKAVCWMDKALSCYFNEETSLGFKEDCPDEFSVESCEPSKEKPAPTCGQRNINGIQEDYDLRIVIQDPDKSTKNNMQRQQTRFGEWPHVCAIINKEDLESSKLNTFQCAGSLINPRVILTAAHCIKDTSNKNLFIRCGEWDTTHGNEILEHQERNVDSIKIHPDYNSGNLHWDVALLITETDFTLSEHINPVCLPSPNETFNISKQLNCVANGWGKDQFGAEGQYQNVLKQVELPMMNNKECQIKLRKTRLGRFFLLDESFICAGGQEDVDTCKGDGGGPLTCLSGDSWVQTGIVSWGIGCGEKGVPAVYASVSKSVCWMDQVLSCHFGLHPRKSFLGFKEDCEKEFLEGTCE